MTCELSKKETLSQSVEVELKKDIYSYINSVLNDLSEQLSTISIQLCEDGKVKIDWGKLESESFLKITMTDDLAYIIFFGIQ